MIRWYWYHSRKWHSATLFSLFWKLVALCHVQLFYQPMVHGFSEISPELHENIFACWSGISPALRNHSRTRFEPAQ